MIAILVQLVDHLFNNKLLQKGFVMPGSRKKIGLISLGLGCFTCGLVFMYSYYRFSSRQPNYNDYNDVVIKSTIIDCNSIIKVLDFVKDFKTLVVFDIDNTLVHPKQELGSDQWFAYLIQKKMADGLSFNDALKKVLPLYYKITELIALYPVEPATGDVIAALEKKGIQVIALTARSLPILRRTLDQLREAGISFEFSDVFNKELKFDIEKPAQLCQAILFCNNNNKGTTLFRVLELCNFVPSAIVFVDDKLLHILEVEKECLAHQVPFVGIRYGRLDKEVKNFDPVVAEQQLNALAATHAQLRTVTAMKLRSYDKN